MNRDCKYDMHVWGTTVLNTKDVFTIITVIILNLSISLAYSISYVTQQGS